VGTTQRPDEDEPAGLVHAQSPPVQVPISTALPLQGPLMLLTVCSGPTQQPR
jgi:hypothetical protein